MISRPNDSFFANDCNCRTISHDVIPSFNHNCGHFIPYYHGRFADN